MHHVKWSTICLSKDKGGLGLRKAKETNKALLAKLGWRILQNESALWIQVMKEKYLRNNSLWSAPRKRDASAAWRGILDARKLLRAGVIWRIGDGQNTKFWIDRWISDGSLDKLTTNPFPETMETLTVSQALNPDGTWCLEILEALLPSQIVTKIRSIPRPITAPLPDQIYWSETADGRFTVKSAFELQQSASASRPGDWKWIWRIPCIERIRTLIWLIMHDKLLTNLSRFFRNLTQNADCPRCVGIQESLSHVFRDCPVARNTWNRLGVTNRSFFEQPFEAWIRTNARATPPNPAATPWFLIFLGAIWQLWTARNLWIFENTRIPPFEITRRSLAIARETAGAITLGSIINNRGPSMVRWIPPPEATFKLNTDGSVNQAAGTASAGGLIRDSQGNWIGGFYTNIGRCTCFEAELWGLREGLLLCRNLNIQNLHVELDSASIVSML